tara:strand:- start:1392 stop:1844 length:453 start_codon:yes stop_codon:yes gene_type:complete
VSDVAANSSLTVARGRRVRLHFSLLLDNGEEVDSTRGGSAGECVIGDGSLLPGFEHAIEGMKAGEGGQIPISAADAFGEHRAGNVQTMKRDDFADLEDLAVGLIVSFAGPGGELPGVIRNLYEESVVVDFNHPLAGRDIVFDVAILSISH